MAPLHWIRLRRQARSLPCLFALICLIGCSPTVSMEGGVRAFSENAGREVRIYTTDKGTLILEALNHYLSEMRAVDRERGQLKPPAPGSAGSVYKAFSRQMANLREREFAALDRWEDFLAMPEAAPLHTITTQEYGYFTVNLARGEAYIAVSLGKRLAVVRHFEADGQTYIQLGREETFTPES